ncbi:MAG: hypothetical protein IH872_08895 [Chloroflexi bacterium]|nr:hypothetical protein [Chloroflexota bacterium]
MGILVAGILVITTFLVASSLMFGTILNGTVEQTQALKELAAINKRLTGSALNITSAAVDTPGGGDVTVVVDNTGSESVFDFADMDVIIQYTDLSGDTTLTYLDFNASTAGANEWTVPVTGVQPDSFNPNAWDSDEALTIDIQVEPKIKKGTSAHVVVGTPQGVADQSDLTNP